LQSLSGPDICDQTNATIQMLSPKHRANEAGFKEWKWQCAMIENQRHTQPPRFSVTEEDWGGVMNAREAFGGGSASRSTKPASLSQMQQRGEKIYLAGSVSSLTGTTARWRLSGVEQL